MRSGYIQLLSNSITIYDVLELIVRYSITGMSCSPQIKNKRFLETFYFFDS